MPGASPKIEANGAWDDRNIVLLSTEISGKKIERENKWIVKYR